jgi:hypothetical protein
VLFALAAGQDAKDLQERLRRMNSYQRLYR